MLVPLPLGATDLRGPIKGVMISFFARYRTARLQWFGSRCPFDPLPAVGEIGQPDLATIIFPLRFMKHTLAICAIVKNEHDYLLEWIAYHRVVGVDHFLIYNNSEENDDGTTRLLKRLHRAGVIELVAWPDRPNWVLPSGVHVRPQIPAYYDGAERLRDRAEWVAFIDADEFIVPMKDTDLPSTLKRYARFGGVGANWRMFGSSGHQKKQDAPVIQRFTMASSPANSVNQHVKAIVRTELIQDVGVHRPFLKSGCFVDEQGRELRHAYGFRYPVTYDLLRINHYYTKSREEWAGKVSRGRASHPQKRSVNHFSDSLFNDENDTFISKFCDATEVKMHELAAAVEMADFPSVANTSSTTKPEAVVIGTPRVASGLLREKEEVEGAPAAPVLDVNLVGGLANRMMQYLVARRIAQKVEGCQLSNAVLSEWGIQHEIFPGPLGAEVIAPQSRHEIDLNRIVERLSSGQTLRGTFQSNVQWLSNFPDLETCRLTFPASEKEFPGFGPEYLVCNLRRDEIFAKDSEKHSVLLPLEFYAEMAHSTGLKLVFMGLEQENEYIRQIKTRFPEAEFYSTRGPRFDFQSFRNSRNLLVTVSTFCWLAAWLSQAERILLPVNGLFHPVQEPDVDLLPVDDERFEFYLFPINYAVPAARLADAHRALLGNWSRTDGQLLHQLRTLCRPRRLEQFVSLFEEAFYLQAYGDVAAAVRKGSLASGLTHYVNQGFHEGRSGFAFDPVWYSIAYPIAAREVGQGGFADLRHHYVEVGAGQGYKPMPSAKEGAA